MKNFKVKAIDLIGILLVVLVLSIYACGPAVIVAGGGIGGSGIISFGGILLIGSADVNGVVYDTDSAQVTLNGVDQGVDNSGLRRGMAVRVDGTLNEDPTGGVSDSVVYEQEVKGPISAVVSTNGQVTVLTILGQTVIIEQDITVVDNGTPNGTDTLPLPFQVDDEYEVSGLREAGSPNAAIRATYLKPETGLAEYVVKGVVENVNASSFTIADLTITSDVSTIGVLPAAGQQVVVEGTLSPANDLVATRIETRVNGLGEVEFERADIEGFLSNLATGPETFTLNGQSVNYTVATFIGGTFSDLIEGVKVEAEGPISEGVLIADKVEFKEAIRIEGDALDSDVDGSFTINGLSGLTVFVDPALTRYAGLANVAGGEPLRIRGRQIAGSGNILATEIKDRSPDSRVEFRAPTTAFTLPPSDSVTLMDTITIDTTGSITFSDLNGTTDRNSFYGRLVIGGLVKARGDLVGGSSVDWTEIELESID